MVLSNPEQHDFFEPVSEEGNMPDATLIEKYADEVFARFLEHKDAALAFRTFFGNHPEFSILSDDEKNHLREQINDVRLQKVTEMAKARAEEMRARRFDEHDREVDKSSNHQGATKPRVIVSRNSVDTRKNWLDETEDRHEATHPPLSSDSPAA